MDPKRVPREYWQDRLEKARSMGLNTIFSYIYWDLLEPTQGQYDFTGINEIETWFQIMQEVGLYGVLRLGPYVCGERDWGGFPAWLMEIDGLVVRDYNQPFLDAAQSYIERVAQEVASAQVTRGGPIIMVQVENEYGNYGGNHAYTAALAVIFKENFQVALYTTNGGWASAVQGGTITGVLSAIDGSPQSGFQARNQYVTDPTSLGPLLDGEYYVTWYDYWGPKNGFDTDTVNSGAISGVLNDLELILSGGNSFSLYMFHGGTNFGFGNGGDSGSGYQSIITSYDYGAPLDETGRPAPIYDDILGVISKYVPSGSIPAFPSTPPMMSTPEIVLTPFAQLLNPLPSATQTSQNPINMEALGQQFGYVLYAYTATGSVSGKLQPGDGPRDRVIVYVSGVKEGVIDTIYSKPATVNVSLKQRDRLWLLVENLGRIDYGGAITDQRKGIVGSITVGATTLQGWSMYSIPLDAPPTSLSGSVSIQSNMPPVWYSGTFSTSNSGSAADTFLTLPGWVKGVVWVNGYNLGRYWTIGPQQSLYIPGCYLSTNSSNTIVVLELEPSPRTKYVQGTATRSWYNNADPDCNNCS